MGWTYGVLGETQINLYFKVPKAPGGSRGSKCKKTPSKKKKGSGKEPVTPILPARIAYDDKSGSIMEQARARSV